MKIALLNFPVDNNYGGNLQRFALMKVLHNLGHHPTHLYTSLHWNYPSVIEQIRRFIKAILHLQSPFIINPEKIAALDYEKQLETILPFYHKYIVHTPIIKSPQELHQYKDFDIFLVGSDQVWRKSMSWQYPFSSMFFDWIKDPTKKKIAYGISFGTDYHEIPAQETANLRKLYNSFDAVSVREKKALDILQELQWTIPHAREVLDPTLLLEKEDYLKVIQDAQTTKPKGNLFCYILDSNVEKESIIKKIAEDKKLKPFYSCIGNKQNESIEQWLRNFSESDYIITDSYHGCIFSIIFNKPFKLLTNKRRGSSRFNSLFQLTGADEEKQFFPWEQIKTRIQTLRLQSISFLEEALSGR